MVVPPSHMDDLWRISRLRGRMNRNGKKGGGGRGGRMVGGGSQGSNGGGTGGGARIRESRIYHPYMTVSHLTDMPRISRIVRHFVDQRTMYLVMERLKLWLSEISLPSNHVLGSKGGG